jgi:hypothetical protein
MRNGAGAGATPVTSSIHGYPLVPNFLSDKTTKEELKRLYHSYVTQHYRECLLLMGVSLLTFCVRTCLLR